VVVRMVRLKNKKQREINMKKNIRCPVCGRKRKASHEKRCGTPKSYNKACQKYSEFDMNVWLKAIEAEKQAKIASLKAEAEAKAKQEEDAKKAEQEKANVASETSTSTAPVAEEVKA
jgi:hypothetical protein